MFTLTTKFRTTAEALKLARHAGFRAAELWLAPDVLREWQQVMALADERLPHYALHFPNETELQYESLEQTVCLYRQLRCEALVIHPGPFASHADQLLALEPSLRLAVENLELSPAEFERWAVEYPGLTLDVEHLWTYTLNHAPLDELIAAVDRFLAVHGSKLRHVHLSGYLPHGPEHRPMHHSAEMVTQVFTLLADYGFSKLVVSETDVEYQNDADMGRDVQLFDQWQSQYTSRRREASQPVVSLRGAGL